MIELQKKTYLVVSHSARIWQLYVSLRRPLSPFRARHSTLQWIIWVSAAELWCLPGFKKDTRAPCEWGTWHFQDDDSNSIFYLFLVFKATVGKSLLMLFWGRVNNSKWCGTLQKAKVKINKYLTRLQILAAELKAMCSLPSRWLPPTQEGTLLHQISRSNIDRGEQRAGN